MSNMLPQVLVGWDWLRSGLEKTLELSISLWLIKYLTLILYTMPRQIQLLLLGFKVKIANCLCLLPGNICVEFA